MSPHLYVNNYLFIVAINHAELIILFDEVESSNKLESEILHAFETAEKNNKTFGYPAV